MSSNSNSGITASMLENVKSSDSDVHISRENQKKINLFAIRNGWLEELNDELALKKSELRNLEDAETEVTLLDDTIPIPIFIGETFVHFDNEKGLEMIKTLMDNVKDDVDRLGNKAREVKKEMADLKKDLYSNFGDSINLECEDE